MLYLKNLIHLLITTYTLMIAARIISSWIPSLAHHTAVRFIAYYTDPYLNLFRRIIPPIGGMLDLSPILGFFALRLIQRILLSLIGQ
ncbi:MAG: YggT family protein [Chlamydiota bacterium]|nr:YggT family protein [Chlamydiota bacterium]